MDKIEAIRAIRANIEESPIILREAWEGKSPKISEKMAVVGKNVGERYIRKQYEESADVKTTNILKRFKQFWAGSYLARYASGETIYADLVYFRSLFANPFWRGEDTSAIFFRINKLWFQIQTAFFKKDRAALVQFAAQLAEESLKFRAAIALDTDNPRNTRILREQGLKNKILSLFTRR